eukprot:Ihof_evm2s965 gene=Ihof_evmTU2s965
MAMSAIKPASRGASLDPPPPLHVKTNKLREQSMQIIASGLAGAFARFSTHPFDTIRTRLQ